MKENLKGTWLYKNNSEVIKVYFENDTITVYSECFSVKDKKYCIIFDEQNNSFLQIQGLDKQIEIRIFELMPTNQITAIIDGKPYDFDRT